MTLRQPLRSADVGEHRISAPVRPVAISAAPDIQQLETRWTALALREEAPFLHWPWVASWLESLPRAALFLEVGDPPGAAGLFCQRRERRRGLPRRVAYLHQSGDPLLDQVWVEYNGLVGAVGDRRQALIDAVAALLERSVADEVQLSMVPRAVGDAILEAFPTARIALEVPGYARNLAALRTEGRSVLDALSSNTRQQVRRAHRQYEAEHGPARLLCAADAEEAVHWFHEAAPWHRARWSDSGFSNPAFVRFHERLIQRGAMAGEARLFRVLFGDHCIGIYYFLIQGNGAFFYLQSVEPPTSPRHKPGLVGHTLLMQHCLDEGFDRYDFLGGDSQYKRQLADQRTEFLVLRVHNGALRFRLEDRARAIRDHWRGG